MKGNKKRAQRNRTEENKLSWSKESQYQLLSISNLSYVKLVGEHLRRKGEVVSWIRL